MCLALFAAAPACAGEQDGDLEGIPRYPNSSLEIQESRETVNYPLISSRLKKVNNEVRADDTNWNDGYLERRLYQMPSGHSSKNVFQYLIRQLNKLDVKPIFTCDGRDCGASNLWANNIFRVAILNGYDRDQFYMLGKRTVKGAEEYYVLYTIKRGNRRVYAMVDRLLAVSQ
nr:DUF4892 domain-containing protein [Sansalvadorimonas sp. 2012CJ34-2]